MRIRSVLFCLQLGILLLLVTSQLANGQSSDDSLDTARPARPSYDESDDPSYSLPDSSDGDFPDSPDQDDSSEPISPTPAPTPFPTSAPKPVPTSAPKPVPTTAPTIMPTSAPQPIPTSNPISSVILSMKLLLVGTSDVDTYYLSAKLTLDSVGATYDSVFVGSILELTGANGAGKYGGLIVATSSALDSNLDEELYNYQLAFGVRKVILYAYPEAPAMQVQGPLSAQDMSFRIPASSFTKGVQLSFTDNIPFGYNATVMDTLAATPVIVGRCSDGSESVVAAVIQRADGTKELQFYVPPTFNEGYTLAFGNIWLQWVSGGMFIGLRRMLWSIQIDDLFLSTVVFDPTTLSQSGASYRCTPADITNLETVLSLVNEYVPGSNLRTEFAFNGAGVQIGGGVTTDPLYLEIKKRQNSFFFESHTFTHPLLDTYTYDQTISELSPNIDLARDFFGTSNSTSCYSSRAMVTPSISGLFNGEALRAIYAMGITSVVGDNSRPELVPQNKYHGIYTSVAIHGFDGMFILPRQVSDIYYDCDSPDSEVAQYKQIYGTAKTLHEIVLLQAQTASKLLLSYRHDPYMFHQANLGSYQMSLGGTVKSTSLLNMWIANTFAQVNRFSTLPFLTYKQEDLADIWKEREFRDNCEVDVQAKVNGAKITTLNLISGKSCRYALTGIDVAPIAGITSTEVYGPDVTTWITLTAGILVQLTLVTPVSL